MEHFIHHNLLSGEVKVAVVGAGGTGSHLINGLVQLHTAMLALGHPGGLDVTVFDDDIVSESNVGRQAFIWSDIDKHKATVLVSRLNLAFGLNWKAAPQRIDDNTPLRSFDLVIGCVDNRAARACIHANAARDAYYLDLGNRLNDGQVVLGEVGSEAYSRGARLRLPTVVDLLPETGQSGLDATDELPSCSLADALDKQGLFINRAMALYALDLLWQLFRHGRVEYHGYFVNMATGRTAPLAIEPAVWERFGYCIKAAA